MKSYGVERENKMNSLLIKNIRIIDPKNNEDFIGDILFKDGKIAEKGENIVLSKNFDIKILQLSKRFDRHFLKFVVSCFAKKAVITFSTLITIFFIIYIINFFIILYSIYTFFDINLFHNLQGSKLKIKQKTEV